MKVEVSYGLERKGMVPDLPGTTPKLCNKCGRWFAAPKRHRVCFGCQPKWLKSRRSEASTQINSGAQAITPESKVRSREHANKAIHPLVRATTRNIARGLQGRDDLSLAIRAANRKPRESAVKFVSHACSSPKEPQAEIAPGDQGRRHPYNGRRPMYSGYCVVLDCACKCHKE